MSLTREKGLVERGPIALVKSDFKTTQDLDWDYIGSCAVLQAEAVSDLLVFAEWQEAAIVSFDRAALLEPSRSGRARVQERAMLARDGLIHRLGVNDDRSQRAIAEICGWLDDALRPFKNCEAIVTPSPANPLVDAGGWPSELHAKMCLIFCRSLWERGTLPNRFASWYAHPPRNPYPW
jgi:hypothetical protein